MRSKVYGGFLLISALSLIARRSEAAPIAVLAQFDPSQGQLPESITRDHQGNVLLSMAVAHTIFKIVPDGQHAAVPVATLPVAAGAFSVGIKVGRDGDIVACSAAFDPALDASHVWRISSSGAVSDLAHLNANGFPNDLVFDDDGDLFVTDSALGLIYKIDDDGSFRVWLSDPRLVGNPQHPLVGSPFGANGIVFDESERRLYVDNLDFGEIFRVRVDEDGSPGPLELFVSDPQLAGADGLAFDEKGHLYVAVNAQNHIAKINRDGAVSIVAQGAPLDSPSSLVFGPEREDATTLFISSFAIAQAIGVAPGVPMPSLDSIQVPFGGLRLP
jgi:sugar lactone lactonase YvrE